MDGLFDKHILKKLRKKGEDYPLHENSRLTAEQFGVLNKFTSKWYQALKGVNSWLTQYPTYKDLFTRIKEVYTYQQKLTDNEAKQYTYAHRLKGLELNQRRSWGALVCWNPIFEWECEGDKVKIKLPADRNWKGQAFPPKFSRLGITFHVLVVNYEDETESVRLHYTKTISIHPDDEQIKSLRTTVPVQLFPNSLVAIMGTAQYYLFDTEQPQERPSFHNQHHACKLLEVFHVKDGNLLKNRDIPSVISKTPSPETDSGTDWE